MGTKGTGVHLPPQACEQSSSRRVLFSTLKREDSPSMDHNESNTSPQFHDAYFAEPLPPYTPVNITLSNHTGPLGQPQYFPSLPPVPNAPVQPAVQHLTGQSAVHPGVFAASAALRISLGLDDARSGPPDQSANNHEIMSTHTHYLTPLMYNQLAMSAVPQHQLLASLYPSALQTQPSLSCSPNLPPM